MRGLACAGIVCAIAVAAGQPPGIPPGRASPPGVPPGAKGEALRPRQPGGMLGDRLGTYMTIEGVKNGPGWPLGTLNLLVDTVDGKKLDKPVVVSVKNLDVPAKQRCIFKGYETGEMDGTPPAVGAAAKERGLKYETPQIVFRWQPLFVPLIAVEPKGLKLPGQEGPSSKLGE